MQIPLQTRRDENHESGADVAIARGWRSVKRRSRELELPSGYDAVAVYESRIKPLVNSGLERPWKTHRTSLHAG